MEGNMYSSPNVSVDEELGFDISAVTDFLKGAGQTAIEYYKQQAQIKQQKAMGLTPQQQQQMMLQQQRMMQMQSQGQFLGMDMTTLLFGAVAIGGVVWFMRRK
jgi:hypothetical protein